MMEKEFVSVTHVPFWKSYLPSFPMGTRSLTSYPSESLQAGLPAKPSADSMAFAGLRTVCSPLVTDHSVCGGGSSM